METTARLCVVCKIRPASKHRLKCNSCKNVHLKDVKRRCTDCPENWAAPGRKTCWNCKYKRHMELHPEDIDKTNARRLKNYKTNKNGYRTKRLQDAGKYRETHVEKTRVDSQIWREAYPERHAANNKRWREENPLRVKANSKRYATENPENLRHNRRLRRIRLRKAKIGRLTAKLWQERVEYFGSCCAYCLKPVEVVTMDHMTPITRGGLHDKSNVVPACADCNSKKYYKNILEWLLYPDTRRFVGIGTPLPKTRLGRRPKAQLLQKSA